MDINPQKTSLSTLLEQFSRDVLVLSKASIVYPPDHPAPRELAENLAGWQPWEKFKEISVGVTPSKLFYQDHFFGAEESRTTLLAELLHSRKVMRLTWSDSVKADDILKFTQLLAPLGPSGEGFVAGLADGGVHSITVTPLDIKKIHGAVATESLFGDDVSEDREKQAWLWLQDVTLSPGNIAKLLASEEVWSAGLNDPELVAKMVLAHGNKLDEALELAGSSEKAEILARIAEVGKGLNLEQMADIVSSTVRTSGGGEVLEALVGVLDGDGFLDLLAGVTVLAGKDTYRLLDVYKRFAPHGSIDKLLPLVESRFNPGEDQGFSLILWQAVEEFLVGLREGEFAGTKYFDTLDEVARQVMIAKDEVSDRLMEDPQIHLDRIHFGMALDLGGEHLRNLFVRLRIRLPVMLTGHLISLVMEIDMYLPGKLDEDRELVREVFALFLRKLRVLTPEERWAVSEFAKSHEPLVLDQVVDALLIEKRLSGRRFLVDLISTLSSSSTAKVIEKALNAPWYLVRNIVASLGMRRDPKSVPILNAFVDHPEEKVRKEALKVLGTFGPKSFGVLRRVEADLLRSGDERAMARRLLKGGEK